MTTTIPPEPQHDAVPWWEAATMDDVWEMSDALGVPACSLFGAVD